MNRFYQYLDDVEEGRVLACDALVKTVARCRRDLAQSRKRGAKYIFDEKAASKAIGFIEQLVQFEEPFTGLPIHLEPWECWFVAQLFGWKLKASGRRRYRKALLFMGRKQGKTILASAIILYLIIFTDGIEAYSLATRQIVANKSFKNLERFIAANRKINSMLKIHKSPRSVYVNANASTYMPLSRDSDLDGLNPAVAHIDELAAQRDGSAYDTLVSGMGTRSEPLTIITSTAAAGLENPLIAEYEYAKQVLDGTLTDDAFLVAIFELDKGDHWDDLGVMQKSCPNLGVSVKLDYLAGELKAAKMIPRKATEYKVKYCNLWQASDQTWIPDKTWYPCIARVKKHAPSFSDLSSLPCFLALDLSTIWDYTALTSYFYSAQAERYRAIHRFYIPAERIDQKVHEENSAIRKWIEDGLIVATPGECIDYSYLYADIDAYLKAHNVLGIVYDPAKAKEFESTYENRAELVTFRQVAANMSPAAKAWEKGIVDGKICDDNPVMRWMLSNAINKANPDSGSYFITKNPTAKARRRIDGVITSIMGYWCLSNWVIADAQPKPFMPDLSRLTY